MNEYSFENIGGDISICVTPEHTFGTDAFLLSYFATPKRKYTVCDLGTGCGIIPLLWFREWETRPKKAYAIDIQPQTMVQLEKTIEKSKNLEDFHPMLADLKEINSYLPADSMDLVTCNPPYNIAGSGIISSGASDIVARHETMCTIDDVCSAAKWLLKFGGKLAICQLPERLTDVMDSMRRHGIEPKRLRMVQNTPYSKPWLVLVEGRRGGKPFLTIEEPLILRENGKTSKEMTKIYGMYGKVD